jgi:hypothetical protein
MLEEFSRSICIVCQSLWLDQQQRLELTGSLGIAADTTKVLQTNLLVIPLTPQLAVGLRGVRLQAALVCREPRGLEWLQSWGQPFARYPGRLDDP